MSSDKVLLRKFSRDNDQSAFEEFIQRHGPMVLKVSSNILWQKNDAEDVFQSVFALAARKANHLAGHKCIAGWLHNTTLNFCLKRRRNVARNLKVAKKEKVKKQHPEPWQEIHTRECQEIIHKAIAELPENHRNVVLLCCLNGFTRQAAAETLNRSVNSIKASLSIGRRLLKQKLNQMGFSIPNLTIGASCTWMLSESSAKAIDTELIDDTLRKLNSTKLQAMKLGSGTSLVPMPLAASTIVAILSSVLMISLTNHVSGEKSLRRFNPQIVLIDKIRPQPELALSPSGLQADLKSFKQDAIHGLQQKALGTEEGTEVLDVWTIERHLKSDIEIKNVIATFSKSGIGGAERFANLNVSVEAGSYKNGPSGYRVYYQRQDFAELLDTNGDQVIDTWKSWYSKTYGWRVSSVDLDGDGFADQTTLNMGTFKTVSATSGRPKNHDSFNIVEIKDFSKLLESIDSPGQQKIKPGDKVRVTFGELEMTKLQGLNGKNGLTGIVSDSGILRFRQFRIDARNMTLEKLEYLLSHVLKKITNSENMIELKICFERPE